MKLTHFSCAGLILLGAASAMAADTFTEDDFTFDFTTNFHKATIIAGVNMLAADNPACAKIDPHTVALDYDRGNPDNPAFSVKCGDGDKQTTVYFSKIDVEAAAAKAKKK